MKEWYIENGQNPIGPLTLDDLKSIKLNREKLVWKEGMKEWVTAENIEELQFLFSKLPPKLPPKPNYKVEGSNDSSKIINELRKKEIKAYGTLCLKKVWVFPIIFAFCYSIPVNFNSGYKALFTKNKLDNFVSSLENSPIKTEYINGQKFVSEYLMMSPSSPERIALDSKFEDFVDNKSQEYYKLQNTLKEIDETTFEIYKANIENSKDAGRKYKIDLGFGFNEFLSPNENMWAPDKISPKTYSVLHYQMKLAFGLKSIIIGIIASLIIYLLFIFYIYRKNRSNA